MENFYILKYIDNWADEMDIESFIILNEEDKVKYYDKAVENLDKLNNKLVICLGTNEEIIFGKSSDFIKTLKIEKISKMEADTIIRYIGEKFGPSDILWDIQNALRYADLLKDKWYYMR